MKTLTFPCLVQSVTDLAYRSTEKSRKESAQWAGRYLVKAQSFGRNEEESYRVSIFFSTHTVSELPRVGQVITVQVELAEEGDPTDPAVGEAHTGSDVDPQYEAAMADRN